MFFWETVFSLLLVLVEIDYEKLDNYVIWVVYCVLGVDEFIKFIRFSVVSRILILKENGIVKIGFLFFFTLLFVFEFIYMGLVGVFYDLVIGEEDFVVWFNEGFYRMS